MISRPCYLLSVGLLLLGIQGQAADHFLTIGGGYAPTGNQASLEKNVLLFQQLIKEKYPSAPAHDIFFSDGTDPGRDLQFRDPELAIPEVNRTLARIFGQEEKLSYRYRSHQVAPVRGGSSRRNIEQWFNTTGPKLKDGDRLFIYVTAHGGKSDSRRQPYNTNLYLWNQEKIKVTEFADLLNKVPDTVHVVTIMVQCHCGGFADLIFNAADPGKGTATANRCGFFATVYDRPAAGCTPDIDEENYHEYSSYFWEALRGVTRTGKPVGNCDYNQDGKISFNEAHAYALITSSTIDISVTTSDSFLRAYAKPSRTTNTNNPALLTSDSPFPQLMNAATPSQQAILTGLSEQLKLTASNRGEAAWNLAKSLTGKKQRPASELSSQQKQLSALRKELRTRITRAWPELDTPFHPALPTLLGQNSEAIMDTIKKHPRYPRLQELEREVDRLQKQVLDLDRRWAKTQRLLRSLETVALAANLPRIATPEVQQRYRQLIEAENGTFGETDATVARQSPAP